MSIANEISRIKTAKASLKNAINSKGGTLTDELLGDYADAVYALNVSGDTPEINLSFVTAAASDILAGKVGVDKDGNPVNGTIPTVTASLTDNVVLIPAGYHDAAILTVPEAEAPTVSGNMVTVNKGYQDAEKIVTVGIAKGAETITPGTADRVINADTYLSGALTIKGDANLIAENIADGVEIFGVPGAHKGGSSGADFYKCAAVHGPYDVQTVIISGCPTAEINGEYIPTEFTTEDGEGNKQTVYKHATANYYYFYEPNNWMTWGVSSDYPSDSLIYRGTAGSSYSWEDSDWNTVDGMTGVYGETTLDADVPKTWDGYKAVLSNGVYSFEETLTTGLSYGDAFTPSKGRIYDATCTVAVSGLYNGLPEGLVFYAPFESDISEAETGQEIKAVGNVSYGNDGNIGYVSITDSSTYISADDAGFPAGNEDRTIICLMRTTGEYSDPFPFLGYGRGSHERNFYLSIENDRFGFDTNNYGAKMQQSFDLSQWHFYALRLQSGKVTAWVDDYSEELATNTFNTELFGRFQIGRWVDHTSFYGAINVAQVMVYNRALSDAEISQFYAKFGQNPEDDPNDPDNGGGSGKAYVYTVSGAGTDIANGNYYDTGDVFDDFPVYKNDNGVYLFHSHNYGWWICSDSAPTPDFDIQHGGHNSYYGWGYNALPTTTQGAGSYGDWVLPAPTITKYAG